MFLVCLEKEEHCKTASVLESSKPHLATSTLKSYGRFLTFFCSIQQSGTEFQRTKEQQAAIMRQKQAEGTHFLVELGVRISRGGRRGIRDRETS